MRQRRSRDPRETGRSADRAYDDRRTPLSSNRTRCQRAAAPQGGHACTERTPDCLIGSAPGAPIPLTPSNFDAHSQTRLFRDAARNAGRRSRGSLEPAKSGVGTRRSALSVTQPLSPVMPATFRYDAMKSIPAFSATIILQAPRPLRGAVARRRASGMGCGVPAGSDRNPALGAASGSPRVHYEALSGAG